MLKEKIKNIISWSDCFIPKIMLLFITFSLIHYGLGYQPKFIYTIGIVAFLVFINSVKFLYISFIWIFTIISTIYFPIAILYGSPSFNILASLFYTNKDEAIGFLSLIPYYYYLFSLLILLLGVFCSRLKIKEIKYVSLISCIIFFIILLSTPIKDWSKKNSINILNTGYPEIKFIKEFYFSLSELNKENSKLENLIYQKDDFNPVVDKNKYNTYVMVIGESDRRDLMNFYGFHINNTPFMNSINGVFFTNYTSAAGSTNPSLTNTIAIKGKLSNNIISLANKAGFYTYWLSNQGSLGILDTPIASMGKKANKYHFLKKGDYGNSNNFSNDTGLLPFIKSAINENKKNKLIIIHLMGSHPPACNRTNNYYETFYKSKDISCYIQSIKNTDKLLNTIHHYLTKNHSKWSMMYFSDHGLSYANRNDINELRIMHGNKYRQNFEVPFFITSYDSKENFYIKEKRSAFSFMNLFSEWTGINDKIINKKCHMISNEKCENQNNVINFNNEIINYFDLPIEKNI